MIKYFIGDIVKKKGLSARGLAAKVGVSPNTASLLIKAKDCGDYNTTMEVLDRVCKVLRCQPGKLLKYVPD